MKEEFDASQQVKHKARIIVVVGNPPYDRFAGAAQAEEAELVAHSCKLGLEGIVSKRKDSPCQGGRSPDWLKMKNPTCAAVKREEEEDWGLHAEHRAACSAASA
jgi:hypothetical protein